MSNTTIQYQHPTLSDLDIKPVLEGTHLEQANNRSYIVTQEKCARIPKFPVPALGHPTDNTGNI